MQVRVAVEGDTEKLAELATRMRVGLGEQTPSMSAESLKLDMFGSPKRLRAFVAVASGEIVGYVSWQDFYEPASRRLGIHVCDLYVGPEVRRQGIARALMARLRAAASKNGRSFLWWLADVKNEEAHGFYVSLGARDAVVRTYTLAVAENQSE